MGLDDGFEHRRVALCVPGTLRIDDRNRTALADAQAVRLGAQDASLLRESQFLQPALEKLPGRQPSLLLAALRRRLIAAEKDVAPGDRDTNGRGNLSLR